MRRLTIIKESTVPHIAHLYEHLYVAGLARILRGRKLLSRLDYSVEGHTSDKGLIHISVTLLSDAALACNPDISGLELSFDETSIAVGISQLVAERGQMFGVDFPKIEKALKELQKEPWTTIEDCGVLGFSKTRYDHRALWLLDAPKAHIKHMKCELILDEATTAQRLLLPLFHVICNVIHANLEDELAAKYGYYVYDEKAYYKSKSAKQTNVFLSSLSHIPQLTDELVMCKNDIIAMLTSDLVNRIKTQLLKINYSDFNSPSDMALFETVGLLVGEAGWRELATEENIHKVLEHTTLQLLYGKEKQAFDIVKLELSS